MAHTKKILKGKSGLPSVHLEGPMKENDDVDDGDVNSVTSDAPSSNSKVTDNDCPIPDDLSELDMNLINSKMTIMSTCDEQGVSLYQHLSEMLTQVLTSWEDAGQAVDQLEDISHHLKEERIRSVSTVLKDYPATHDLVARQWALFKKIGREIPETNPVYGPRSVRDEGAEKRRDSQDDSDSSNKRGGSPSRGEEDGKPTDGSLETRLRVLPDIMRQCNMFAMAGVGLPGTEYTRVALAMRELASTLTFKSIRFWGKILGTQKNYYVVETRLYEDDYDLDDDDDDDNDELNDVIDDDVSPSRATSSLSDDTVPMAYRKPLPTPKEISGQGVNAFVYYACNEPGMPWIRLPDATPQHITTARQITSLFTGELEHILATYPPFPGNEANYLRAQVARITSGTCISPIGHFKFDEDDEEEEHAESRDACVKNDDFEGVSHRDLSDPTVQFWVHHINDILPQGRTMWFNPLDNPALEDENEEEMEEERKEPDDPIPEIPQPLLMPVSEDVELDQSPAWIARQSSQYIPGQHSPVVVHSVRWPGAVAAATDKGHFYENLYVGWGVKALESTFDPALPPEAAWEFPTGPEVIEQEDPTPEEEAAIRAALKEQEELMGEREDEDEEEDGDAEGDEEEIEDD